METAAYQRIIFRPDMITYFPKRNIKLCWNTYIRRRSGQQRTIAGPTWMPGPTCLAAGFPGCVYKVTMGTTTTGPRLAWLVLMRSASGRAPGKCRDAASWCAGTGLSSQGTGTNVANVYAEKGSPEQQASIAGRAWMPAFRPTPTGLH
jgi:hypothetical protein